MRTFVKTSAVPQGSRIMAVAVLDLPPEEAGWIELAPQSWTGWINPEQPGKAPFLTPQFTVEWIDCRDIEIERVKKRAEIDSWRLAANYDKFTHQGKVVRCDQTSRGDIEATNQRILMTGQLPPNWPGAWKAMNQQYIPITTIEQWNEFFFSFFDQGMSNFLRSETLKAQVAAATTIEQIQALSW